MRKQSLLFIAGAMLALASCQNNTENTENSQAQIDSAVNAREEQLRMEMQAKNDSIITAEAQRKADSIAATKTTASAPARSNTKKSTGGTKTPTNNTNNNNVNNNTTKPVTSESKWNQGNDQKGTTSESKWNQNQSGDKKDQPSSKSKWE